jgi:hypothetical protein
MVALIDDVKEVALSMAVVVVDDDSFDMADPTCPEHHQDEINVHLNKSI